MKVSAPMHSMDARGKFGVALTFAKVRGGNVIKSVCRVPASRAAVLPPTYGYLIQLTKEWGLLDPADQELWRVWALTQFVDDKLTDPYHPTASNSFCKLNGALLNCGLPKVTKPPTGPGPGQLTGFWLIGNGAEPVGFSAHWDDTYTNDYVETRYQGPRPAGRAFYPREYHLHGYTYTSDCGFGVSGLVPGGVYGVQCRRIAVDGQVSPLIGGEIIATPNP